MSSYHPTILIPKTDKKCDLTGKKIEKCEPLLNINGILVKHSEGDKIYKSLDNPECTKNINLEKGSDVKCKCGNPSKVYMSASISQIGKGVELEKGLCTSCINNLKERKKEIENEMYWVGGLFCLHKMENWRDGKKDCVTGNKIDPGAIIYLPISPLGVTNIKNIDTLIEKFKNNYTSKIMGNKEFCSICQGQSKNFSRIQFYPDEQIICKKCSVRYVKELKKMKDEKEKFIVSILI